MRNQYIFLPWLRKGLSKNIVEHDPLSEASGGISQKVSVNVNVKVLADDNEQASVSKKVELIGPGDIAAISRSAIVKTDPVPGAKSFEPNFFPYIDFYEEDFIWRYSPAKAAGAKRLRPWLSLIVLTESEFTRLTVRSAGNSKVIRINSPNISELFPPSSQLWAWGHVQINDANLTDAQLAENSRNQSVASSLKANPNLGVSRLICPRKLQSKTTYYAFLVPSYESGRLAGLGSKKTEIDAVGRFEPSWKSTGGDNRFPVYYEWSFKTGVDNFETLARKIVPRDLSGSDVGKLWMDSNNINYGELFDYKGNLEPANPQRKGFIPYQGALRLVSDAVPNMLERNGAAEKEFTDRFSKLINLGVQYRHKSKQELEWGITALENDKDDPLLVPPIYGRWYVKLDGDVTVDSTRSGNWPDQLNLDPAFRVAAGLGAEVIREHQEQFMSRSWQQLADERKRLNKEIQTLRFSQEVSKAIYNKHFTAAPGAEAQNAGKYLALTRSVHSIIKIDNAGGTIAAKVAEGKTDAAFVQPMYRKLTRSSGPVMKRVSTSTTYNSVVMSYTTQFSTIALIFFPVDPPFQNFDSKKLAQVDVTKFSYTRFGRRDVGTGVGLPMPNWYGTIPVRLLATFTVDKTAFEASLTALIGHPLKKPVLASAKPITAESVTFFTAKLAEKIIPARSFVAKLNAKIPKNSAPAVTSSEVISPNSFNPFFPDPMFEPLGKLRQELFIPNLEKILPDSFALLQENSAFVEGYLVGLNHELGAEFLWRGFPADLNATYFRQFWDMNDGGAWGTDKYQILPIRNWKTSQKLGANGPAGKMKDPLVFVIKAELIQKYPNLVVYAQEAKFENGFRKPNKESAARLPIFLSHMSPDYLFAGFNLSELDVLGTTADGSGNKAGWYFVIAERPGEMHFGMDQERTRPYNSWNDLAWTDLAINVDYLDLQTDIPKSPPNNNGFEWGKGQNPVNDDPAAGTGDSAQMAAILQRKPVQIFIHASMLISKTT